MALVRWVWAVLLAALALVSLGLAPATGLATAPFGLCAAGLALWLGPGYANERLRSIAAWCVGIGMVGVVGLIVWVVLA